MDSPITNGNAAGNDPDLYAQAKASSKLAVNFAWDLYRPDHHWLGELRANSAITSQHIFFYQALGLIIPDIDGYRQYLLSQQQSDGSWSIAPDYPGDLSMSAEAYLALRILEVSSDEPALQQARRFIRMRGGIARVRIFTRIFFAQFGLFPWSSVPQLPAEVIFLPSSLPLNIYRLSSWARSTLVPLFIIRHHEKVHALPNGAHVNNAFLDELWLRPDKKDVPYSGSLLDLWTSDAILYTFGAIDSGLTLMSKIRPLWIFRSLARKKCIRWILEHQEKEGDWGGIATLMHASIHALILEGHSLQDDCVRRGIIAIERFTWKDDQGKRLQFSVSPVWDTVLMLRGLCGTNVNKNDERISQAVKWIKSRQILRREGDWHVYGRSIGPGGFCFEYNNSWYPDVDDTAATILALISQDPMSIGSSSILKATLWVCGMQNLDGGWAAFDINNNKLWLNKIPFSDMDGLCDPSSADVTGRVLEAFGLLLKLSEKEYIEPNIIQKIQVASTKAMTYLAQEQTSFGAWYGRWGSNYLYGTSNVVCGLAYFSKGNEEVQDMLSAATAWLSRMQNSDGGWGEDLESYQDLSLAGKGSSTPSQTSWVLLALLATSNPRDKSITNGISHLVNTQTDIKGRGASWPESNSAKEALSKSTESGFYTKTVLVFEQPWWRSANLSGVYSSADGPIVFTHDTCVPEDGQFSITCFHAVDLGRKCTVVDAVSMPIEVIEKDWTREPWICGAPGPVWRPGFLAGEAGDSVAEPFGNIHFVGTETSREWRGYLEGAVQSGIRGGKEVIAALGKAVV
ncbi:squalene cyclase [Fusarium austroafricanum]|uniref:Terpene cyclase/mutase family member n=1 Tax=Fusarium austroafricanum TaxID=2364996 RepID=A0A8H4KY99_9HYPO|nr:squalene cyclase [Fusarium austroafricanum]